MDINSIIMKKRAKGELDYCLIGYGITLNI